MKKIALVIVISFMMLVCGIGVIHASPMLDGTLDASPYTLAYATTAGAHSCFGGANNCSAIYYSYDANSVYFFVTANIDGTGNGLILLVGSSAAAGYNAGWNLGDVVSASGNGVFTLGSGANGNWEMDFPVNVGIEVNAFGGTTPSGGNLFYVNDAIYFNASSFATSGYIGGISSNGGVVSGGIGVSQAIVSYDNSGNSSGPGNSTGLEVAFPRVGSALGTLTSGVVLKAFAIIVSNTGYFSNCGVPTNFPSGCPGDNPNFGSAGLENPGPNNVTTSPLEDFPSAGFSASPQSGFGALTVVFSDTSYGIITGWNWDFGDGNSTTIQNPTYVYGTVVAPTTYVVTLIVNNLLGTSTATTNISVTEEGANASFTVNTNSGNGPLAVTFMDNSNYPNPSTATTWTWVFGDGNIGSGATTSYIYSAVTVPTTYSVFEIISTAFGLSTSSNQTITVTESPSTAAFTVDTSSGNGPLTVTFMDNSVYPTSSSFTTWTWIFGDGYTASSATTQHIYAAVTATTNYTSYEIVSTSFGVSTSSSQIITVDGQVSVITPTLDGILDSGYTLLWSTTAPARNDLGTGDNVSAIYYTYDAKSVYFFFQGALDIVGNGIAALFGSSASSGYNAGWLLGQDSGSNNAIFTLGTNGSSNNNGEGDWGMDFPVSDGLYIGGFVSDKYVNDAIYAGDGVTSSSETSGYIGDITSNGLIVSGGVTGVAATFNNSGNNSGSGSSNGLEIAFPRNGTLGNLTAGATVSAFAVVVSHTGYFSNDGVPMNFPVGTVGFDINFDSTGSTEGPGPNHVTTLPLEDVPFAGFSASTQSGFGALTVLFSDTSYGIITGWNWDFGDGNSTTIQNPTYVYGTVAAPTTYVVTLIVNNLLGTSTATTAITVTETGPSASFSATSTSGYGPVQFQFNDGTSYPTGSSYTTWAWDFGDGVGTSSLENPTYTYGAVMAPTQYTVTLIVTTPFGVSTSIQSNYISVSEARPTASFSASSTSGNGPVQFQFNDGSSYPTPSNTTTWAWDFGDGIGTSSQENPSYTYGAVLVPTEYTVQLIVTTDFGTSTSTQVNYISVNEAAPISNYTVTPSSGYGPYTAVFVDTSVYPTSSFTTFEWIFGDGNTTGFMTSTTTTYQYQVVSSPTTYTSWEIVSTSFGVSSSSQSVNVLSPVSFSVTPNNGDGPYTATFIDTSNNPTSSYTTFAWIFGDGNSTDFTSSTTTTYQYQSVSVPTTYTAWEIVSTSFGVGSSSQVVGVGEPAPVSSFTVTPNSGDGPYTATFVDTSVYPISSYTTFEWIFGDGNAADFTTSTTTTYQYQAVSAPTTYTAWEILSTSFGVSSSSQPVSVTEAGPVVNFTVTPNSGNGPYIATFIDTSIYPTSSFTTFEWIFGDGNATDFTTSTTTSYQYQAVSAPTTYTAWEIVSTSFGVSSSSQSVNVTESGPSTSFTGTPLSGYGALTVNFTDGTSYPTGSSYTTWAWDFGDGIGTSSLENPTYTYGAVMAPTQYTVTLIVTTPFGVSTSIQSNYISVSEARPTASFSASSTSGNGPVQFQFNDGSSYPTPSNTTTWAWDFGDGIGTSSQENPSYTYGAVLVPTEYTVQLIVTTDFGTSTSTQVNYISVNEAAPISNYTVTPSSGYGPYTAVFVDTSVYPTSSFTTFEWIFGDGNTTGFMTSTTTTYQYQVVSAPTTYTSWEIVSTSFGVSSSSQSVNVLSPVSFSVTPNNGDGPYTATFVDTSNNPTSSYTTFAWIFGDGNSTDFTSSTTTTYQYQSVSVPTTYTAWEIVSTSFGVGSSSQVVGVGEPAPTSSFTVTPNSGDGPYTATFVDTSIYPTSSYTTFAWIFGDGNAADFTASTTTTYQYQAVSAPTTYTAWEILSTSFGVSSSSQLVSVTEAGPVVSFTVTPNSGNGPYTATFIDTSIYPPSSFTTFEWIFGDGNATDFTTSTTTSYQYQAVSAPTTYTAWEIVSTSFGVSSSSQTVSVTEAGPSASFSASSTSGYGSLPIQFTDGTVYPTSSAYTTWAWDFGDGVGTSSLENPTYTYGAVMAPTQYTVTLIVTTPFGVSTSIQINYISVSEARPTASFSASSTSGNGPVQFQFNDGSSYPAPSNTTTWAWDFGDGIGTSSQENPSYTYGAVLVPTEYTVQLIVTTDFGTSTSTQVNYISVNEAAPISNYTVTPSSGYGPYTAVFVDTSVYPTSSFTTFEWVFGDGNTTGFMTSTTTTYQYQVVSAPTTYTSWEIVSTSFGVSSSSQSVNVLSPVSFSVTPNNGDGPYTATFVDTSNNPTSSYTTFAWIFGDGNSTDFTSSTTTTYQYQSVSVPTTYTAWEIVSTSFGVGSSSQVVGVGEPAPTSSFTVTPNSGDGPYTATFVDTSIYPTSSYTTFAWIFGDGNAADFTASTTTTYQYQAVSAPTTYTAWEILSTSFGVSSSSQLVSVTEAGPVVSFTVTPNSGNGPYTATFIDTSIYPPSSFTTFEWIFGDGNATDFTTSTTTSYQYQAVSAPTTYTAWEIVSTSFGVSSSSQTVSVTEAGAVAGFYGSPLSGYGPLTVNFTDTSLNNPTSWNWSFGDGGTDTIDQNPQYVYVPVSAPTSYTVTLIVSNAFGSSTATALNYISVSEPLLNITANPPLGGSVSPASGYYMLGTTVTCLATPSTSSGYVFTGWTGDLTGNVNPQTLLMDTAKNVVANFATWVSVTVNSIPPGLTVVVNGTNQITPYSFVTAPDSCFTIGVVTTQPGGIGTQYVYGSWDDGGLTTHTVCLSSNTTFTAIFNTQYYLSLVANPSTAGTFSPSSGWYYSGTTLNLQAIATAGYVFNHWTGDLVGFNNPTTIVMNTFKNITGNFNSGVMVTVYSNVPSATVVVGGVVETTPYSFATTVDACFDINAISPQSPGAGTQYSYDSWSDSGGQDHTVCAPVDTTLTVYFDTQYYLTTQVNPAGSGTINPPSGWYTANTVLSCLAIPGSSQLFSGWSGNLSGSSNPQNLSMNTAKTIIANFSTSTISYLISGYVYNFSSSFTIVGSELMPNFAYNVAVNGNYAYIADYTNGLQVVDISNPATPTIVGYASSPGQEQAVTMDRSYAYVADGYSGMRIVDVSNPTAPAEVGHVDTLGYTWDVTVQGNYAYLADWSQGLDVVNISTATNPAIVGNYVTPGLAYGVAVQGNYAYVADGSAGLRIIDISNPASPMEVSSYNTTGFVLSVAVSGNYAYVADDSSGLRIVDISTPTHPVEVGVSGTPGSATDVSVNGNFAYLADGLAGMRVFDVTDPTTPFDLGTVNTGGNAVGINAQGPYIYVADGTGGLEIIQVGDPLPGVTMTMTGDTSQVTVTNANGYYQFVNYANGNYTVTPSKSPYYFSPTNRTYTDLNADQYQQNYIAGTSAFVTINAPSNLSAVIASPHEIDLLWVSNSNNESGFGILRQVNNGSWSLLTTVSAGQISFANTGLTTGDIYCYKVYAFNGFNQSGYSNEACVTLSIVTTPILTPVFVNLPDVKLFINQTLAPAFDLTLFNIGSAATTASIVTDFLGVSSISTSYNGSILTSADIAYTGYASATVVTNSYSLGNIYGAETASNLLKYSTYKIKELPEVGLNPGESYFLNIANYTFDTTGLAIPPSFGNVSALIVSDTTLVNATWSGTTAVNITLIASSSATPVTVDIIASPNSNSPFVSDMDKERVYVYTNLLSNGTFSTAIDTAAYGLEFAPGRTTLTPQSWVSSYTDSQGLEGDGVWAFNFADASSGIKGTPFFSNYINLMSGQWYTARIRLVADAPNTHESDLFGFSNLVGQGLQTDIAAQILFGIPTVWTWQEIPFYVHSNSTSGYPQFILKAGNAGNVYIDEIQLIQAEPILVQANRYPTQLRYPYGDFNVSSDTSGWGEQLYAGSTGAPLFSVSSGLILNFTGAGPSPMELGIKWTANNNMPGTVYTPQVSPPQQVGVRLTVSIESGDFNSLAIILVAAYGVQSAGQLGIAVAPSNLIAAAEVGRLVAGDVRAVGQSINPFYQFQFGVRSDLPGILDISNVDFDQDNDDPNYGDGSLFP